jgi:hypothetical protein
MLSSAALLFALPLDHKLCLKSGLQFCGQSRVPLTRPPGLLHPCKRPRPPHTAARLKAPIIDCLVAPAVMRPSMFLLSGNPISFTDSNGNSMSVTESVSCPYPYTYTEG